MLLLSTIPFIWAWFWRRGKTDIAPSVDGYRLSFLSIAGFQGLIIAAGWAVTIQGQWRLANTVLAVLYMIYLFASAVLLRQLWCRFPGSR
jgi:hypothetical protein